MQSSQQLDLESVSQTLKDKNILPSKLKFGFLGLGIMGSGIVKNLLNSGHSVIVWNRTTDKVRFFFFPFLQNHSYGFFLPQKEYKFWLAISPSILKRITKFNNDLKNVIRLSQNIWFLFSKVSHVAKTRNRA